MEAADEVEHFFESSTPPDSFFCSGGLPSSEPPAPSGGDGGGVGAVGGDDDGPAPSPKRTESFPRCFAERPSPEDLVGESGDEVDDVEVVVAWLREKKKASHIGMWGRSMGAVVCLLYGKRDPTIAGIVLDSPFASLVSLMEELAASHKLLTGFLTKPLISILRRSIRKRANFDILKANPLKAVSSSFIPALFGHGKEDDFVAFKHSERLYEAYAGDKNLISFDGGHNSPRPDFFHTSVLIFFMNVLGPLSAGSPSPVRRTGSPNTIPDEVLLQEALALSLT